MSEINNTQNPNANLELMQLPAPDPVSMWPDTLAWELLLIALVLVVVYFIWSLFRKHQRSLWKREAHALAIEAKKQANADVWFTLIKRVLLVHQDKTTLDQLSDIEILSEVGQFSDNEIKALKEAHYQKQTSISESTNESVYHAVAAWLKELPEVQNV